MNEQDYLEELMEHLSCVRCHDKLKYDLFSILAKSGQEGKFLGVLLTALQILRIHGTDAIYVRRRQFEKLSHEAALFSMRVNLPQVNCRILYTFFRGEPVLLYGFWERQGHRKTDYSSAIKIARSRMDEWRAKYE